VRCADCGEAVARVGKDTCYRCHVRSLGFSYRGASYGRGDFHNQTIAERQREAMSTNPNVEPI
jgi:hypothetical protein